MRELGCVRLRRSARTLKTQKPGIKPLRLDLLGLALLVQDLQDQ